MMNKKNFLLTLIVATLAAHTYAAETIALVRHGEKPEAGLGQLSCKGLRRALALPPVLLARFGHIDAVYAPNPSNLKRDQGKPYDYVRPLATIEPTAIRLGLPVDTQIGFADIDSLQKVLTQPQLADKTIVVAWEHHYAEDMVRAMIKQAGGDVASVPVWRDDDFDSIYIVTIDKNTDGSPKVHFELGHEGLAGLADTCPSN